MMRCNFRFAVVIFGLTVVLALCAEVSCAGRKLVLYNRTPSVPVGWYVYAGRSPHVGDVVAFALPTAAHGYARARGESTGVRLLKPVLATRGDCVSTSDGELRVNGVSYGSIAGVDSAGRPLPQWHADHVLAAGELVVGSRAAQSFDSRFFGPIHAGDVQGVYRRIEFASSHAAPTVPPAHSSTARASIHHP